MFEEISMDKIDMIFIDLDGVLVDLHRSLIRLWGDDPEQYSEAQWAEVGEWGLSVYKGNFWDRVRSQGQQWWVNLPKLEWCDRLWEACLGTGVECVILTTPGPFPESVSGKWQWVVDNLCTRKMLIGAPKHGCSAEGRLLIEDRNSYGEKWRARGGQFISVRRPWNRNGYDIEDVIKFLKLHCKL